MNADLKNPLSPLQLELLKTFAMPSVNESDLLEIRKMLSQYFAQKASRQAQKIVDERNLSAHDIETIAHEHRRASTAQP